MFSEVVNECYDEVVHWQRNVFKVPSGKVGKTFVRELAHILDAFAEASALKGVAMKALMILPPLLLQKVTPIIKSKRSCSASKTSLNFVETG
jgi:hypothetical protein